MPLRLLLTGASGHLGRLVLLQLVEAGHTVIATDMGPAAPAEPSPSPSSYTYIPADLTSLAAVDALFDSALAGGHALDGVIHFGAVPNPCTGLDHRQVHANNVVSSYNVLRTAADRGVTRLVQASSVNAHGLSYSIQEHVRFDTFPIDENVEKRDEDAYALSKHICEIQADSLVRLYPDDLRIASLRLHMVRESYAAAVPDSSARDLFSWVSHAAITRACILVITCDASKLAGHEVFNIVAPTICWEGTAEQQSMVPLDCAEGEKASTLALLEAFGRTPPTIDSEYFRKNPRAAVWTCAKAEKVLGWRHDE